MRGRERSWLYSPSWRRCVANIARVTAVGGKPDSVTVPVLAGLAAIQAGDGNRCIWLAPGYPLELCQAVAADIADRLTKTEQRPVELNTSEMSLKDFVVTATKTIQPSPVVRREQPPESDITVERLPNGITVNVPATGLRGAAKFMVIFGAICPDSRLRWAPR